MTDFKLATRKISKHAKNTANLFVFQNKVSIFATHFRGSAYSRKTVW